MKDFFSKNVFLGENSQGQGVFLDPDTRKEHLQTIGSTGEGKSYFLQHLIQEDIINGDGLCLIDPHGSLYDNVVKWCAVNSHILDGRRKIILINPSETSWTFNFNPLRPRAGADISFIIDRMIQGCAKVWGVEGTDQTPLLERCLRAILYALVDKGLPLSDSKLLVRPPSRAVREYLTKDLPNDIYRIEWQNFNSLKPKEFDDLFLSTINRLLRFLGSEVVRSIVGQVTGSIDFTQLMDEGAILLVNLNTKNIYSEESARLLGTLIINDLQICAKARAVGDRPFYLYIDECYDYLSGDIAKILNECRKFGLHLILAHQYLYQLTDKGENIYHGVMTNAKSKVIFGGLSPEDAEILAEQAFMGEIDLDEPIRILDKPVVVGYETTILKGRSHSRGTTRSEGESRSSGSGLSQSTGQSLTYDPNQSFFLSQVQTDSSGEGFSSFWSDGLSSSFGEIESQGESESEALRPILETLPSAVYDLEKQRYKKKALLINLPKQCAIIKLPKQKAQTVVIPTIATYDLPSETIRNFEQEHYKMYGFLKPREEVINSINAREKDITERSKQQAPVKEEPATFREASAPKALKADEVIRPPKSQARKKEAEPKKFRS